MENLPKFLLEKYRLPLGIILIAAILVGGGVLALTQKISPTPNTPRKTNEATASSALVPAAAKIKIDIAGAVVNPGVYKLPEDARVEDALNTAGGLSEEADRDWVVKNLNLAEKLSDGDKLYIPKAGENTTPSSANTSIPVPPPSSAGVVSGSSKPSDCSRVNINTASAGILDECLLGIGPTKAQSIIEYRETHGGFKSIEEIKNVKGIAEGTFAKIKDQIVVD